MFSNVILNNFKIKTLNVFLKEIKKITIYTVFLNINFILLNLKKQSNFYFKQEN